MPLRWLRLLTRITYDCKIIGICRLDATRNSLGISDRLFHHFFSFHVYSAARGVVADGKTEKTWLLFLAGLR
ncbi:hypothetical protein AHT46_14030 [Salmonella enterica]|nr:hypothetical protein [Salmonella enterica subsp. enterica]EAA7840152.1 hypothetical protein [Salmonella enterica]EBW4676444.1 hypothetical protein [Salmonella enterica subsp. salamae serovar Sofia]ECC9157544.1 hypothetical protein [Salmonella enterica subsp. salamae]HAC6698831.1 hypothetical protein [Salmonella bongori serovar 66:z65:-]